MGKRSMNEVRRARAVHRDVGLAVRRPVDRLAPHAASAVRQAVPAIEVEGRPARDVQVGPPEVTAGVDPSCLHERALVALMRISARGPAAES